MQSKRTSGCLAGVIYWAEMWRPLCRQKSPRAWRQRRANCIV